MNRTRAAAAAFALALLATACAAVPAPPPWQATGLRDHVLVGRIWHTASQLFVSKDDLAKALVAAELVFLGETHDNPDHHRIQAWAVDRIFAAGSKPGLAIEMIREDQQATLDTYRAQAPGKVEGIGPALGWSHSGWLAWRHYAPVVAPFIHHRRPIRTANLPRDRIRPLAREGFSALGAARAATLGLDRPFPAEMLADMAAEQVEAHCGQIPAARAAPFARIQIARDAIMAGALVGAAKGGKAVLVAGSGHVRRDRGVPYQLERRGVRTTTLVLAPMEVREKDLQPESYGANYDYLWFTPRQHRDDPCASLRNR